MSRLQVLLILCLLICASLTVHAQGPTPLVINTPVERTISQAVNHEFTVTVDEHAFVQCVVEQRGADVVVRVFSPAAKIIGEFDSPNGADGTEDVSFVALVAGSYRIVVSLLDQNNPTPGRYQIKLQELRAATEQELKASQGAEIAKAKGIALLGEMDGIIPQIKSPFTRINAQLQAGQLLAESDPKRSTKYLTDAANGVKELIATIDTTSPKYSIQYSWISQLRFEMTRILALRDPDAALNFLYSTVPPPNPFAVQREQESQESMMELSIATQIMQKDPNRALQIARKNLKAGFSPMLMNTVGQLRRQNPELAAELASEITTKILAEKLIKSPNAANVAINLLRSGGRPEKRSTPLSGYAEQPKTSLLTDAQYRDLLQKALTEALSYTQTSIQNYSPEREAALRLLRGLQPFGGELDTVVPGGYAALEKKLIAMNAQLRPSQQSENILANNPADTALETIEKAPADQREGLYLGLANREANSGDVARARQIINERVTNAFQRRNALSNVDQQEIYLLLAKNKVEDALRLISSLSTPRERASQVAQIAAQIGQGRKRVAAINLLEQTKSVLGPSAQAQDQDHMNALLEISRAFARYDSKRSFEILDPLVDQVNELCSAARTMEGFGPEYYDEDELNLQNGNGVAQAVTRISITLATLAVTNFDRSKAEADRLQLPEVRLRVYLDIAQQTIAGVGK